jgi:hypothetical protein
MVLEGHRRSSWIERRGIQRAPAEKATYDLEAVHVASCEAERAERVGRKGTFNSYRHEFCLTNED